MATPSSLMSDDASPENAGPEWRTKWSTLDVNQANALLDKIGLTKKDPQGLRLRTDNGQLLRLTVTTVAAAFLPYAQMMEMVAQHWKKIGIQLDVKDTERNLSLKQRGRQRAAALRLGRRQRRHLHVAAPRHAGRAERAVQRHPLRHLVRLGRHRRARSRRIRSCSRRTTCSARAPAWRPPSGTSSGQELKKLIVDQQWVIGTVGFNPILRVIGNKMGNVPDRYAWVTRARTPGAAHPPTYYLKS